MPLDPYWVTEEARRIADFYYQAEVALLRKIRDDALRLGQADDADLVKLRQLANFERTAKQTLNDAHRALLAEIDIILERAVRDGRAAAALDLQQLGYPPAVMPDQIAAVKLIAHDMTQTALALQPRALRNALDAYQTVQAYATGQVLLGSLTRLDASQWALNDFARRGITTFTDKAGRNWYADTYAEMTVRTGTMHAIVETHLDSYSASGIDLVLVSDSPRECDLCRQWEHKILTINGGAGQYRLADALTGGTAVVDVVANIEQARAGGLFHPNCTHNVTPYVPGATLDTPTIDNPDLYETTQRQRYIERQLRYWTRRDAAALDRRAQAKADAKLQQWNDEMQKLLDTNIELNRRPEREDPFTAR